MHTPVGPSQTAHLLRLNSKIHQAFQCQQASYIPDLVKLQGSLLNRFAGSLIPSG